MLCLLNGRILCLLSDIFAECYVCWILFLPNAVSAELLYWMRYRLNAEATKWCVCWITNLLNAGSAYLCVCLILCLLNAMSAIWCVAKCCVCWRTCLLNTVSYEKGSSNVACAWCCVCWICYVCWAFCLLTAVSIECCVGWMLFLQYAVSADYLFHLMLSLFNVCRLNIVST